MLKANDFVCTLAPMKNWMVSITNNIITALLGWRFFSPALSLLRIDCLVGRLAKVKVVLAPKKGGGGSRPLLLETLTLDSCLSRDLQQTLTTTNGVLWCVKPCGRCSFRNENLSICCVSGSVIALWVHQPECFLGASAVAGEMRQVRAYIRRGPGDNYQEELRVCRGGRGCAPLRHSERAPGRNSDIIKCQDHRRTFRGRGLWAKAGSQVPLFRSEPQEVTLGIFFYLPGPHLQMQFTVPPSWGGWENNVHSVLSSVSGTYLAIIIFINFLLL